jgi:hypothetical protein
MSKIGKLYGIFTIGFSAYGFYRGYNTEDDFKTYKFYSDKYIHGLCNMTVYAIPPFQIFALCRLINRCEIKYKNMDPTDHKQEYTELTGIFYKTI